MVTKRPSATRRRRRLSPKLPPSFRIIAICPEVRVHLFWRYRWFWLIVIACAGVDLLSKSIVFDRLGVSDQDIHEAVRLSYETLSQETKDYHDELARHKQRLASGQLIPGERMPSEPRLLISLDPTRRFTIVDKRLHFTAVLNAGAFGGLLGGQIAVLVVLSVVAVGVVAWVLLRSALPRYQVVSGLIIAGALGNIHDRLVFGCVRDFIDFWWPEVPVSWMNPWNTFNFADSCIVIGIIGLLLLEFFFPIEPAKRKEADPKASADSSGAGSSVAPVEPVAPDASAPMTANVAATPAIPAAPPSA